MNKRGIHYARTAFLPALVLLCASFLLMPAERSSSAMPPPKTGLTLTSIDMGNPPPKPGTTEVVNEGNGIRLQGFGTMFGMHLDSDQGRFAYAKIRGDFDVILQIDGVSSGSEAFAEGGLMVRRDLNPSGLMVANFVTNNNCRAETDQYTFMFRVKERGNLEPYWDMAIDGFYGDRTKGNPGFGYSARGWSADNQPPRNFPYVWLRIIRQGNTYKGYKRSGVRTNWGEWEKLAEITVDLGEEPFVGIALSANHHHPKIAGKIGDPESMSEISVLSATGFPSAGAD
jgi:hypothetical protein